MSHLQISGKMIIEREKRNKKIQLNNLKLVN